MPKSKLTNEEGRLNLTNAQILDTVRKYAPNDYKERVPATTQGSVVATLQAMNNYMPNWDVFWNVFLGRIGRVQINDRMNFTNPLAKLKRPAMRYGRTIQEVQANLIKARAYDAKAENVFGREGREPDIHQIFHTENRRDKYVINIPMEGVMRGSFIEGESISSFFNSLTEAPIASANNDEYLLMRSLLETYDNLWGFWNINVPDMHDLSENLDAKISAGVQLITAMNATYTKMKYFRTEYSPEGRNKGLATRSNRLIALIDADVNAALEAANMSYAFHNEKQKPIADDIIVLDELPISGCQALLLDEEWFQVADTLGPISMVSPMNPDNLSYNTFYHVWQVLSYTIFLGATMFSTRPDSEITAAQATYTGVTLQDAAGNTSSTIQPGEDVQLIAKVTGTNSPNQAVVYSIKAFNGRGAVQTLPAEMFVDSNGVFHSGNCHDIDKVTIAATSVADSQYQALYTVTVAGATYMTALAGAAVNVKVGANAASALTWTPSGGTDKSYEAYSADDSIATVANVADDVLTVSGVAEGETTIVLVAKGGDPTKPNVVAKVTVTVTA
jgi:hypothetical protein|nr:MAG TPA: Head protein [Caudoviricetes sp.]